MTIAVNTVALATIKNKTIAEFIPVSNTTIDLPSEITFENNEFHLNTKLSLTDNITFTTQTKSPSENQYNTELVIFSDLSITLFTELLSLCDLSIESLSAINQRNQLISYRFYVDVNDVALARKKLVQFNLDNNIESILITDSPTLSAPGVLLMDMDSTTIKIECIDELAKLAGVGEQVAEVTELAMQGKLDFTQSLHQRVATLSGSPISILDTVISTLPLMEGLETLVAELKQHNWRVAIASGGFTYFADHLKQMLALDSAVANTLEIIDGKLTGKVLGDVVDAQAKADNLLTLAKEYDIDVSQTVAMGDGANDLVMMNAAALGVAFHAKQLVVDKADVGINTLGLDCLLHWLK